MSGLIEINLRPDSRTLRQFGFLALGGFAFLGAIAWMEWLIFAFGLGAARVPVASVFAALAALSLLFSLVYPRANLPVYLALTVLGYPIGFVLSYVIMATWFYAIIAPIGLALRVLGRAPIARGFARERETYWEDARKAPSNGRYFKQF